ncbi:MAG: RsmE family RNA methyltransferase [Phycisphaerales bacterium]
MSTHTIFLPDLRTRALSAPAGSPASVSGAGARLLIGGEEAHHALRVKRLETGDRVRFCDGRGGVAEGTIAETRKERRSGEWQFDADCGPVEVTPPDAPRLRVWSGVPKGDGLGQMIDGLSQVGATGWAPLVSARTIVEPREGKLRRLERVAEEAIKQCGRSWLLEIGEGWELAQVLDAGGTLIAADVSGDEYTRTGAEALGLLIGPEGGWDPRELALMRSRGVRIARFGPHVMRVEVAAVVGAALVMQSERAVR